MQKGTVKWFNAAKGYGFIADDNGQDIFVHYTGIAAEGFRTLVEGQEVSFDTAPGTKGPQAVNVTVI